MYARASSKLRNERAAYPTKSPYDSQPDDAYVLLGLLGMSCGRVPDELHAFHSFQLFRPSSRTYVRASSNVRYGQDTLPFAYPRKSPNDVQPDDLYF